MLILETVANRPYAQSVARRPVPIEWMPVVFGLAVICFESTRIMGGSATGRWLADIWPSDLLGQANTPYFGAIHHFLRKAGHFSGYGLLGLLFRQAWYGSIRAYMRLARGQRALSAAALSIACTFLIGSLDEWHQSFVPGRTSTRLDVLIDTSGALLANVIFWSVVSYRRRSLRPRERRVVLKRPVLPRPLAGLLLKPAAKRQSWQAS